jgi:hypothetical protein
VAACSEADASNRLLAAKAQIDLNMVMFLIVVLVTSILIRLLDSGRRFGVQLGRYPLI